MIVQNASFLSSSPWLVPFCISSLKGKTLNEFPTTIDLCSTRYYLGGFSMFRSGHFTGVVNWQGKRFLYDGMGETDQMQLQDIKEVHFDGQAGSYAYYFKSTN